MTKRLTTARQVKHDGTSPLHWSGFFFALALMLAVLGSSSPNDTAAGASARALFFVFLVLGIVPLLVCAKEET
jgi:uncharacterized membrane protein YtjA (UPF0391 family)